MAVRTPERRVQERWQIDAACRGPEASVFFPPTFPERRDDREVRERHAKMICASCPVRVDCLEHAVAIREQHGIWGGLNEAERRPLMEARAG